MIQRKSTAGKRRLLPAIAAAIVLCLSQFVMLLAFSQTNVALIRPSSRDYLFDERHPFETAAVGDLLSQREQHYLDGLLERGLTHVAEQYCRKRLRFDSTVDSQFDSQKAGYARALLQSQKQRLCNAPPHDRDAVRMQIAQTNRGIDAMFAASPYSTVIALQQLDVAISDAELQLADQTPERSERTAAQLDEILARIDAETSMAAAQTTFVKLLQFRKAVALRLLAQCRPERQTESLAAAIAILRSMIVTGNTPAFASEQKALSHLAAFEAATCYRGLQQYDEIETLLNQLRNDDDLSPRHRALLPTIELLSAVDRRDEAATHIALHAIETALADAKSLDVTRQIERGVPELTIARLQGYLFFWKRNLETQSSVPEIVGTTTAPQLAVCRTNVIEILRESESDFAPYWRQRAESIISREAAFFGNDPVFAEQRADTLLRQGRIDEAIAACDSLAASLGATEPNEAFRVARKAADLLAVKADRQWQSISGTNRPNASQRMIDDAKALEQSLVDRLRPLARSRPNHPLAIETHLAAAYHAARLMQLDESKIDDYLSLLTEHYLTWPQSQQADAFRVQAARLLFLESKYREAVETLTPVDNRSSVATDAVETVDRCFDRMRLSEPDVNGAVESEAVSWFYSRLLNADNGIKSDWNAADGQCLLGTAKYGLLYTSVIERNRASNANVDLAIAYGSIEKVLRAGLTRYQQASPEWRSAADSMLLYLLTVQGKTDEASQLMQAMRQWDVAALVSLLERLQQQADVSPPERRQTLGQMRLDVLQIIEQKSDASQQNASDSRRLGVILADALADTGKAQNAVDQLGEMLRQSPGDVELLVALARILGRQSDAKARGSALQIWRTVEQRSPSRSETWWDAKEAIIRLLVTSDDATQRQQADAAFEMLQILNPDLGGPERKLRFETMFKNRN